MVNLGRLMTKARKVPSLGSPYGQLMKNPLINGKPWWKLASLIQIYWSITGIFANRKVSEWTSILELRITRSTSIWTVALVRKEFSKSIRLRPRLLRWDHQTRFRLMATNRTRNSAANLKTKWNPKSQKRSDAAWPSPLKISRKENRNIKSRNHTGWLLRVPWKPRRP